MKTYPEMDKEIVKLLDMEGMPLSVYAARYIEELQTEIIELRARLDKAVEVENKINNGELVGAIWFKSWLNGQICSGRVIGYDDGGFVIESGDDLISAKNIYTSRQQAENGENKNGDDLPF